MFIGVLFALKSLTISTLFGILALFVVLSLWFTVSG